ncbi:50S ribosomal protein L29 [Candidatus Parcubacteria bacterium]|nr:MAG: 50S ribosomal protein L29 [Candidatus Parcubacteria bacterium]
MADIKKKSIEVLKKEVAEKREALRVFRFGETGTRTRNVREGRNVRREIARILTELRMREKGEKLATKPIKK